MITVQKLPETAQSMFLGQISSMKKLIPFMVEKILMNMLFVAYLMERANGNNLYIQNHRHVMFRGRNDWVQQQHLVEMTTKNRKRNVKMVCHR